MTKKNDGGPVFPREQGRTPEGTWNQSFETGMTLRDWFAGRALAGLTGNIGTNKWKIAKTVDEAYQYADAMLKEREKE